MPSVIELLNDRYSINAILPNIRYQNKVRLSFSEDYPAERRERLLYKLNNLHVKQDYPPISSLNLVDVSVALNNAGLIVFSCDLIGNNNISLLGGNKVELTLSLNSFGDAETDAAWLVYMLTQNDFFNIQQLAGNKMLLDINVYSMRQQKSASAIKGAAAAHLKTNSGNPLHQYIYNKANALCGPFAAQAPKFSERIVPQEKWPEIESTNGHLIKKKQTADVNFDAKLYNGRFAADIENYITFISENDDILINAISNTASEIINELKKYCFMSLKSALVQARSMIKEKCENDASMLQNLVFKGATYTSLKAKDVEFMFDRQNTDYAQYTRIKLIAFIADRLCAEILKYYENVYEHVVTSINNCLDDANLISCLQADDLQGVVPWDSFDYLPESLLNVGEMNLTEFAQAFISMNKVINNFSVSAWISGNTSLVANNISIASGLNDDILVSLGMRSLS